MNRLGDGQVRLVLAAECERTWYDYRSWI